MPPHPPEPDLEISLDLHLDAPRSARELVGSIDCPSRELRERSTLLTSEVVTRAVRQRRPDLQEVVKLRVWMPDEVLRVELQAPHEDLLRPPEAVGPHYDHMLLDQLADRWSIEAHGDLACVWFEIDRRD